MTLINAEATGNSDGKRKTSTPDKADRLDARMTLKNGLLGNRASKRNERNPPRRACSNLRLYWRF